METLVVLYVFERINQVRKAFLSVFGRCAQLSLAQVSVLLEVQDQLALMRYLSKNRSLVALQGVTVFPDPLSISLDLLPGGDLSSYLRDETRSSTLNWGLRLRIATGMYHFVFMAVVCARGRLTLLS